MELDVDVSVDDIINALQDSPDTVSAACQMLNRTAVVIKSITDKIIDGMNSSQRQVVSRFFSAQAARFAAGESEIAPLQQPPVDFIQKPVDSAL